MGATDCTHVPIKAPNDNEHLFVNGKQHHSLNIQVVANSEHYILIMCVPHTLAALMMHSYGATHLRQRFENGDFGNSIYLVG